MTMLSFPSSVAEERTSVIFLISSILLGVMFLTLYGCGSGGEGDPMVSTTATPVGAMATLQWDPVQVQTGQPPIIGYYIHYGTQSSSRSGSCAYQNSTFVTAPIGTVTGLDKGSRYYFAVSAYNGVESSCSNEVFADT